MQDFKLLEFFIEQRINGNDQYWTTTQLADMLNISKHRSILVKKCRSLFWHDYLEVVTEFPTKYRVKQRYVDKVTNGRTTKLN